MTAVNMIRQSAAVHMLTDGAFFNPDGTLRGTITKAYLFPQLNAVIGFRGSFSAAHLFSTALQNFGDGFDGLRAKLPAFVKDNLAPEAPLWRLPDFQQDLHEVEIYVAGWSESEGPSSYSVWSHSREPSVAPFTILDPGHLAMAPGVPGCSEYAPAGVECSDDLDPMVHGIEIMEMQRAAQIPHPQTGKSQSIVGGFVQLTTVTAVGISTSIIRRWPDAIGHRIASTAR